MVYDPGYQYPAISARSSAVVSKCTVLMIRAAALWLHFVEVERPEVADFCRMVLPEPAVRQIIGKSIETVGQTVKIDPSRPVASGLRAGQRGSGTQRQWISYRAAGIT